MNKIHSINMKYDIPLIMHEIPQIVTSLTDNYHIHQVYQNTINVSHSKGHIEGAYICWSKQVAEILEICQCLMRWQ